MIKFRWEPEFKTTEIGEIPKDWETIRLAEVMTNIEKGKVPKKSPGVYPYLSVDYLRGNSNNAEFYGKGVGVFVTQNDILMIWDGVINAGEIFRGVKGLLSSTMCRLIYDKTKIHRDYLYHTLKLFEPIIREARRGTDDRHVDKSMFLSIKIPYPFLSEQSRIATVLSWFDNLIENKKRQNEILEKAAMAIFKSWFVDFEPFKDGEFVYNEELDREVPKGWEVKKLGDFAEIIMGQSPPSKYYNYKRKGLPFVQGKGQYGKYTPETTVYCSRLVKIAKPYDILVTVRAPVGELNLSDCEYVIGRGVASLRSKYWAFLFLYLLTDNERLKSYERGTTYDAITKEEVDSFSLLLPPFSILQRFHSLVEPLFQKIILNQKQIMVLRKIRDALLPQLIFGKLRVAEL